MKPSPGERLRFLLVPGPEIARAWELIDGQIPYDREAYTELLLRAVETLLMPVGVDRATLETWLLGHAGYWGPPGTLPPPGVDPRMPLLQQIGPTNVREMPQFSPLLPALSTCEEMR